MKQKETLLSAQIVAFCKRYNLTEDQFFGKEKINGSLDLRSVTALIPGFNPTVGGSLDLSSVTTLISGFNPTVGGDLDLRSVTKIIRSTDIPKLLSWQNGKYIKVDGIFTEVIKKTGNLYLAKKVNVPDEFYLATDGKWNYAHGATKEKAKADLRFKIIAEKLKKDPIKPDTMLTVLYYRTVTGACDLGCRQWLDANKIPYKIEGESTVEVKPISAKDLLPLLEKSGAYGLDRIKSLITF